jgi:hypothetical protein
MRAGRGRVASSWITVAVLTVAALFPALSISAASGTLDHRGGPRMGIEQVLDRHSKQLLELPGVTGMGIGEQSGKPKIVIMVTNPHARREGQPSANA